MIRKALFILLIIAIFARLILYLYYNNPTSLDVWPLIRSSDIIIRDPMIKIWNDTIFDGYNNHWPATILTNTILSLILLIPPEEVYSIISPVAIVTCIILTIIVFTRDRFYSSAVPIALMFPFVIFTSTALKEVYSYPLLLLILYIIFQKTFSRRNLFLLAVLSIASVLSHYFSTLIFIEIFLFSIPLYMYIRDILGVRSVNIDIRNIVIALLFLAVLFYVYNSVYGLGPYGMNRIIPDVYSYTLYSLGIGLVYILSMRRSVEKKFVIALFIVIISLTLSTVYLGIIPRTYTHRSLFELYVFSTFIPLLLPLVISRYYLSSYVDVVIHGLSMMIIINIMYIVFFSGTYSILHRFLLYIAYLSALLASKSLNKYLHTYIFALLMFLIFIYHLNNLFVGLDEVVNSWFFNSREIYTANIAKYIDPELVVSSDSKFSYFLALVHPVDVSRFVAFVSMNSFSVCRDCLLIIYSRGLVNGFVVSTEIYRLSPGSSKIFYDVSKIFDIGGEVFGYTT